MIRHFFIIASLFLTGCRQSAEPVISQQQVIPGELPDPSVIEVNGIYYATGSSNDWAPVFPLYKSADLIHWSFVAYLFDTPPDWTISSYWAPELFYHNGKFYCYYTARNKNGVSCIGVATATSPEEGFQDHGPLIEWGSEAIDAFVYKDADTLYITWKAYGLDPDRPIQILGSKLADDGLSLTGSAFTLLTAEEDSWEQGGIEGQCIIEHDSYLYLFYSGNACCGKDCDYKVGVARAKSMEGPWERYDQNPVLTSNKHWKCPGHGTAVEAEGQWYYLYHAYHQKGFPNLGRSALLSQVSWDKNSGWPSFSIDSAKPDITVSATDFADEFNTPGLAHQWLHPLPQTGFTAAIENGTLLLNDDQPGNGSPAGAILGIVPESADFTVSATVSNKNEALKGLTLYVTEKNSLGFGVRGDSLVAWKVKDGRFSTLKARYLDYSGAVRLKAVVKNAKEVVFDFSADGRQWSCFTTTAADNLAWWSWGMRVGLAVKPDATHVQTLGVFDNFSVDYK